jgi:hypothetical protein
MSTLTTHTTASRDSHSEGLCKFNTTSKAIEVSDGTNWLVYDYDSLASIYLPVTNNLSLELDGTNDHVNCGNDSALNLTTGFTINCYARQDDTGINTIVQRRTGSNGYQVTLNSGTFEYFGGVARNFGTGYTSTTDWYMLTVTHTGGTNGTLKGYVNGSLVNTFTDTYTSVASQNFYIGRNFAGDVYSHNGYIDEVGVWSRVLGADEISDIYNSGTPVDISPSSNLIGYWRMGDGSGDTDSGSGTPTAGDTVGTVKNLANPGTHDGTGSGGALYSSTTP